MQGHCNFTLGTILYWTQRFLSVRPLSLFSNAHGTPLLILKPSYRERGSPVGRLKGEGGYQAVNGSHRAFSAARIASPTSAGRG